MKKTVLATSLAIALGTSAGAAQAATQAYNPYPGISGSNFTMLSNNGGAIGGTNDVSGSWDGTVYTSCSSAGAQCNYSGGVSSSAVSNMSLSSPTTFFGANWTAHNIELFGQGTYTFTETNGKTQTMKVGANQVGAHMLFDWGATSNIGVADVFNLNSPQTGAFFTGGGSTSDSWSGVASTNWGLESTGGQAMVNGPFLGYQANFNVYNGNAVTSGVSAVPVPAAVWLFGSGLIGLVGVGRRKKSA